MQNFVSDLTDYVKSGHALLHVDTFEKDRAIKDIAAVAETTGKKMLIWSVARGWINDRGKNPNNLKETDPVEDHIRVIKEFDDNTICVLRDFGVYLQHDTYPNADVVISWLDELRRVIASVGQTIIFVGPDFKVPKPLLHDITRIDFNLPDNEQIVERIDFVCSSVETSDGKKMEPSKDVLPQIMDACRGMTSQQTVDRVALALTKHKDLTEDAVQTIIKEKAGIIRASGLLTYIEPPSGGLATVGGYDALKQHVMLDKPCFTESAREFGIEFPRGLMLVGIPGCGKTLLSLAIASELGLPLISMDVGNLMDKWVGESEGNMREAIKMLESISPCVLQLDEIEKGFGDSGDSGSGASRRVFGTFIKWLNDRQSPVYIVATANQVISLPPEFCRKGRFDEIYGLDLPGIDERAEIFSIHISKRGREPGNYSITQLAIETEGYTGADIEQIVKLGLKKSFADGVELDTTHLRSCIKDIIPLSKTEADRISHTREWCKNHAKPANPQNDKRTKTTNRKVVVG
jgi:hypothetical protein